MNHPAVNPAHPPARRFGRFELQPQERRLLVDGAPANLGARAFDLLVALAAQPGQLVTKNDLLSLVWPDVVVEENNLQVQISALRKLLGPQVIATVPGRGYRFTAAFDSTADQPPRTALPDATPVVEKHADAPAVRHTNLPAHLPVLYGRDADVTALCALLDSYALVTVVGAGGIGKSRLAQAAAHALAESWPDGAWMVELAGLADPALLPHSVAQVLGIQMARQGAALEEVVAGMAQRSLLLVLDNCEHLLEAAAALAQAVLLRAPNVKLLATSQEPLHLPAEQQYRLMPLPVPADSTASGQREFGAIALFEARVRAADPRFALTDENLLAVIDICRRLDGLPLAIELAAARVATLGLRPVRDKLDARFKLLTGGSRTTLRRHQTLRAALEWSYNLLDDAERAVFRRLGVFAGGFTMELAQAVAGDAELDEWAVLDHLSALVEKSLVVADAGETPRYRLLESARAFALERLADEGTVDGQARHAQAMLDFLRRVDDANLDGELPTDHFAALLLPELDNLRAAHAWASGVGGDAQVAIALAAHAGSLIGYTLEGIDWLLPLLPRVADGAVDPATAARYWRALAGEGMYLRVPTGLQADAAIRARDLYLSLGKPRRAFSSLIFLSGIREDQADLAAAQVALDEASALIRPDWPAWFHLRVIRRRGTLTRRAGHFAESLALHREGLRRSVSMGDHHLEQVSRSLLVDLLWEMGPLEEAAREARMLAADRRTRPTGDGELIAFSFNLIGILCESGCVEEATAAAHEILPILRRAGFPSLESLVYLFWRRGQLDAAALLLGATDALRVRIGAAPEPNERRLIAETRPALAKEMQSDVLAALITAGAAFDNAELYEVIDKALKQPIAAQR